MSYSADELNAMETRQLFDILRDGCDEYLQPVINHCEARWELSSSAAKLWFRHAAEDIGAERHKLDREAVKQEWNVG